MLALIGCVLAWVEIRPCGSAQPLDEHRHHGGDHDPLPAPLASGIVAVGVVGGGASFIHIGHRLMTGKDQGLLHVLLQRGAAPLADCGDRSTAHLDPQQLIQEPLGLAVTQREGTAQQTHQSTEPWTVMTGLGARISAAEPGSDHWLPSRQAVKQ